MMNRKYSLNDVRDILTAVARNCKAGDREVAVYNTVFNKRSNNRIKSACIVLSRDDIELLVIDDDKRKDNNEIRKFINESDITFLCLPDAAAIEAVALLDRDKNIINIHINE